MKFIQVSILTSAQKKEVIQLWNDEYPLRLRHENEQEFDDYLEKIDNLKHTLVFDIKDKLISWYCEFDRDSERWFALLINLEYQGHGIGTQLLNRAKKQTNTLNAWVVDNNNEILERGTNYKSPLSE